VGTSYLIYAWIFHGFGLGLILVPLATESIRRIPQHLVGVSSGMFNLMRNEGGSVGIAISTTILAQRAQFHHARLAEHATPFSANLQAGFMKLARGFFPYAGQSPASMPGLAAGLVGAETTRQSFLMAFVDVFAALMVVFALALPFVLLLRNFRKGEDVTPALE